MVIFFLLCNAKKFTWKKGEILVYLNTSKHPTADVGGPFRQVWCYVERNFWKKLEKDISWVLKTNLDIGLERNEVKFLSDFTDVTIVSRWKLGSKKFWNSNSWSDMWKLWQNLKTKWNVVKPYGNYFEVRTLLVTKGLRADYIETSEISASSVTWKGLDSKSSGMIHWCATLLCSTFPRFIIHFRPFHPLKKDLSISQNIAIDFFGLFEFE